MAPPAPLLAFALGLVAAACGGLDQGEPFNVPVCPSDQLACGQVCVAFTSDPRNCGGCGIPCAASQSCQAGVCQCAPGTFDDNGTCVTADAGATETAGPPPARLPTLVTSAPGAYWQTGAPPAVVANAKADVTVDATILAQTWEGMGGAFNELGWYYLSLLSDDDRATALQLLYGADGARFAFGRIPIGASDYAMDRYTLDETAGDTGLADFSIARDKERLIPFVKAAQAVKGNIRFWASPWTPPTWMKDGPFSPGKVPSSFDGGTMKTDDGTLATFAQYLIRFVQAYADQGIAIEAVSAQNEPSYTGNYPTCGWSATTYARFIGRHLGPAIAAAGLDTRIILGTFNGGDADPGIVGRVMGDVLARDYVNVLGFQWGMESRVAAATSYHLPIWQSEHKCGNYPWLKPFDAERAPNDDAYAAESWDLIRDWVRAGVTAYAAWNMVLDTTGVGIDTTRVWPQDALLTVDTQTRTLVVTPTYYVFRHLSRFVATGAKVAATSGGDALAFKNPDGSIVTVLHNSGAARTMTLAVNGTAVEFAVPESGFATVVLP